MTIQNGEIVARNNEYITLARKLATQLWNTIHGLQDLQAEWMALDYTNTLPDGTGINAGYTKQEVSDVVNTTTNALVELMNAGHGTNVAKLLSFLIVFGAIINRL